MGKMVNTDKNNCSCYFIENLSGGNGNGNGNGNNGPAGGNGQPGPNGSSGPNGPPGPNGPDYQGKICRIVAIHDRLNKLLNS